MPLYPRECSSCGQVFYTKSAYFNCDTHSGALAKRKLKESISNVTISTATPTPASPPHELLPESQPSSQKQWATEVNSMLTDLLLVMERRNFAETDITNVLEHFEKVLGFALSHTMEENELEVAMELSFDKLTTPYHRKELQKVTILKAFKNFVNNFCRAYLQQNQ